MYLPPANRIFDCIRNPLCWVRNYGTTKENWSDLQLNSVTSSPANLGRNSRQRKDGIISMSHTPVPGVSNDCHSREILVRAHQLTDVSFQHTGRSSYASSRASRTSYLSRRYTITCPLPTAGDSRVKARRSNGRSSPPRTRCTRASTAPKHCISTRSQITKLASRCRSCGIRSWTRLSTMRVARSSGCFIPNSMICFPPRSVMSIYIPRS